MARMLVSIMAALGVVGLFASAAAAQPTLDEVVAAVESDGFYAERGADVDADGLADLVAGANGLAVVVLVDDDPDGADLAADQVRSAIGGDTTVLVVSPGEVGANSSRFTDADLDTALDDTLATFDRGGTTLDAVSSFAQSLELTRPAEAPPEPTAATESQESSGGGGAGTLIVVLLIIAAIIGGLFWFAKRKAKTVDTGEVDRAKAEIKAQLEVVAHDIVEHQDAIDVADNEQAIEYFRAANATYVEVSEEVEETTNLLDLAELNDQIDVARWQLDAAEALSEGRDVPPKPEPDKPSACFFDPTHKPGTHDCTIKTGAGDKEVRVCERCADKLERGERPEPRMIDVGGRPVPAAKAPRSHGGLGMGGLSIFEVILGGLGALTAARGRSQPSAAPRRSSRSVGLDWGEMLPKRRPSGDVFGQDRQPPRPRGLPTTRASRSSGSSRRSRSRRPGRSLRRR